MSTSVAGGQSVPWWKEPTKEQWLAWWAAWMGWTLDSFDFTVFLLIMVPISKEFNVPLTEVTAVFAITLWLRLVGATASGWLADRVGRKIPLMISILWYSICNFIAGFSPTFTFLFFFRALLGIGMGAEWPAGASLAMESWPARSRGLMSSVLQGSWASGLPGLERRIRPAVRSHRLARPALDRHPPRTGRCLGAQVRPGTARSGWRTAGSSARRRSRFTCRCSRSSSAVCWPTR